MWLSRGHSELSGWPSAEISASLFALCLSVSERPCVASWPEDVCGRVLRAPQKTSTLEPEISPVLMFQITRVLRVKGRIYSVCFCKYEIEHTHTHILSRGVRWDWLAVLGMAGFGSIVLVLVQTVTSSVFTYVHKQWRGVLEDRISCTLCQVSNFSYFVFGFSSPCRGKQWRKLAGAAKTQLRASMSCGVVTTSRQLWFHLNRIERKKKTNAQ